MNGWVLSGALALLLYPTGLRTNTVERWKLPRPASNQRSETAAIDWQK